MLLPASKSTRIAETLRNRWMLTVMMSLVLLAFSGPPILAGEPDTSALALEAPQTGLPVTTMSVSGKTYRLEVAATPEQAEKGLMFRTSLPERQGMLFLFHPAQPVKFWMKNTKIPLDMLFLSGQQVSFVQSGAQPCVADPCAIYGPDTPVDMVVELPAGTARRHHIAPGSHVQVNWPNLVKQAAPRAASRPGK